MIKRLKKNSLSDFHDAFIIAFGIRDTSDYTGFIALPNGSNRFHRNAYRMM